MQLARVAALALLVLLPACKRELDLPAVDGFIAGRVLESEESGAPPLAGVAVSVQGSNLAAVSDGQGLFAVGPMPGGTYRVLLDRRDPNGGRRSRLFSGVQAKGGATISLGNISLRESAQVTGRVLLE